MVVVSSELWLCEVPSCARCLRHGGLLYSPGLSFGAQYTDIWPGLVVHGVRHGTCRTSQTSVSIEGKTDQEFLPAGVTNRRTGSPQTSPRIFRVRLPAHSALGCVTS